MLKTMKSRKPREAGYTAVEFALALLVFIPLLFVILDFGWVCFQKIAFEYGYMHSSWEVRASDVGDFGSLDLEGVASENTITGAAVETPIYDQMKKFASMIIKENLSVSDAQAEFYNEAVPYDVPTISGGSTQGVSRTRYMELSAKITYVIYPLTPFGDKLFSGSLTVVKDLNCKRIVGTQHRSE